MTDAIDLREIERWLDWPELEWSRFGPMCVRLLRALTEVGVPEDAMPAASVAHDLLDAIDCGARLAGVRAHGRARTLPL